MPRSRRLSWRCRTRSTSCRGPALVRGHSGRSGPVRLGARVGALLFSLLWVIALSSAAAASRPDAGIATGQIEDGPDGENEKAAPPAGEPVDPGRGQARFEAALRLFTAGKQPDGASAAAAALEQLARELPADEIAPEALFEAAQLNDEQLGRPDQAERLYEALLRGYPSSRLVRRAESRLGQLREGLRTGTDALIRFQRIIRATSEGSAERIAQLSALLRERPEFALADQTLYLLGSAQLRAGQDEAAAGSFATLFSRFPASEWAAYGHKAQADALIAKGRCEPARRHLRALGERRGTVWVRAAEEGLQQCSLLERRRVWSRLALAYLAVVGGGLLLRARRTLWPPPLEVYYYAPVAGFLVLVSLGIKGGLYLGPVLLLAGSGAALSWLGAAAARRAVRHKRGGAARRALQLIAGLLWRALAVAAICYLVVDSQGLFELLIETVRNGADE